MAVMVSSLTSHGAHIRPYKIVRILEIPFDSQYTVNPFSGCIYICFRGVGDYWIRVLGRK